MRRALLASVLLLGAVLAGCGSPATPDPSVPYTSLPGYVRDDEGRNATSWPDLSNETLVLLDNGAFQGTFDEAAKQFKALTGITVKLEDGVDTLASLDKLQKSKHSGKYDLIWGVDNMILQRAIRGGDLVQYRPALADRIDPDLVFFDNSTWFATPADHGYIALNVDTTYAGFNQSVDNLAKLLLYSDKLVIENPKTSSPGLGFLLATIGHYGENPPYSTALYDWREYWRDLFEGPDRNNDGSSDGCLLVAQTWKEAYETHFSAGYGLANGGLGDKPIVVSYTQSPAYEAFFGMPRNKIATPIAGDLSAYHQIQTIAIANGTKHMQAAQAWVEFTLTDHFQELVAPKDVMYPVVPGIDVNSTFGGLDPKPGSFTAVEFSQAELKSGYNEKNPKSVANLDRWIKEWTDLYEDPQVNKCL